MSEEFIDNSFPVPWSLLEWMEKNPGKEPIITGWDIFREKPPNVKVGKEEPTLQTVILDWDYDDFSVLPNGNIILHYLDKYPPFLYIEGWLQPGNKLKKTLFKRVADREYERRTSKQTDVKDN